MEFKLSIYTKNIRYDENIYIKQTKSENNLHQLAANKLSQTKRAKELEDTRSISKVDFKNFENKLQTFKNEPSMNKMQKDILFFCDGDHIINSGTKKTVYTFNSSKLLALCPKGDFIEPARERLDSHYFSIPLAQDWFNFQLVKDFGLDNFSILEILINKNPIPEKNSNRIPETLIQLIESRQFGKIILQIMKAPIKALCYLHQNDLWFGDFKLENCTPKGLIDLDTIQKTSEIIKLQLTPEYTHPEAEKVLFSNFTTIENLIKSKQYIQGETTIAPHGIRFFLEQIARDSSIKLKTYGGNLRDFFLIPENKEYFMQIIDFEIKTQYENIILKQHKKHIDLYSLSVAIIYLCLYTIRATNKLENSLRNNLLLTIKDKETKHKLQQQLKHYIKHVEKKETNFIQLELLDHLIVKGYLLPTLNKKYDDFSEGILPILEKFIELEQYK
ncbi:MAG: hypothetical protein CMP39_06015 [Rickettsiales bacterium]|nr:hypothetical protein [Rickettsiales bacterium]